MNDSTAVRFGAGLSGRDDLAAARMRETPQPEAREPLRRPMTLKIGSHHVRGLTVDVPVRHLCGADVVVVMQPGWLPDDPFFDLAEQRAEHEALIAKAEAAEAALVALRQDLLDERQRRAQQLVAGDVKRPRPDAERLLAEAEEVAVASKGQIVAFADEIMALIVERAEGWKATLAQRDAEAQQALAEARAALDAAQEQAQGTYAGRQWLDGQGFGTKEPFQVVSWAATARARPPAVADPVAQALAQKMQGWA